MSQKQSFIETILKSKQMNTSQKERFLVLASHEFEKVEDLQKDLAKQLEDVKTKLEGLEGGGVIVDTFSVKEKTHTPKTMVKFFFRFSREDKFKWFTHDPEGLISDFNYKEYVDFAKKDFNVLTGWNINDRTYVHVKKFIFGAVTTSKANEQVSENSNFSWGDIAKWCEENPNKHPFNAKINDTYFSYYIKQFQQSIEFRTDEADMTFNFQIKKIVRQVLGFDFKVNFEDSFNEIGQSMRIFCDINLLTAAIKQILDWINKNKSKSNLVQINLFDVGLDYYQFEIVHENSYLSSSIDNEKLLGLSGDFDKVRKLLFCVADWEMITTLEYNGIKANYKITCLNHETKLKSKTLTPNKIHLYEGTNHEVKHIFKLYKTQNL